MTLVAAVTDAVGSTKASREASAHASTRGDETSGGVAVQPGGEINMQQLLQEAQKMQEQLSTAQEELADARVEGTAGGGLVTATVTGAGELVGLVIDPRAVEGEEPAETAETVADMVLAAVRDASGRVAELQQQKMAPLAEGLGGGMGLPGA